MTRVSPLGAAAITAAFLLAGCGGGGTSPSPAASTASTTSSHTKVGTARLTLVLPRVVTAKGTTSSARANGTGARPQYINPTPNGMVGPCTGENVLDIYVNGLLQPALDGGPEAPDSLCVAATPDSTQTVNIPLYSTVNSQIVVAEWDATFAHGLAVGEVDYGAFAPGTAVTLPALTMQMIVQYAEVTDLGFASPHKMDGTSWSYLTGSCPGTAQFAVFPADGLGTFVPVAGYGGTGTTAPVVTFTPNGTKLAQTPVPGTYNVIWDGSCDSIVVMASVANPSYPLFYDAQTSSGAYPGIDYLYYNDVNGYAFGNKFANALNAAANSTVNGTLQIVWGG